MRVGIVVTARLQSLRFPGKVLAPLTKDQTVLGLQLLRLGASKEADVVVVATPDQVVAEAANQYGFIGVEDRTNDPSAVVQRVEGAASQGGFGVVVHVAGSQPLVDAAVVDKLVQIYRESSAHVVICEKPVGCRIAVMTKYTLSQGINRMMELQSDPGKMVSPPPTGLRIAKFKAVETPYRFNVEMVSDLQFVRALVDAAGPMAGVGKLAQVAKLPEMKDVATVDETITKTLARLEG